MVSVKALASTTFRSLHTRNYKLFFFGQGASLIGTWTQTIAIGWLVLSLSGNSGTAIGFVIALQFVPTLLLSAYAGVLADRFDKRKLLIFSQVGQAVVAALLGVIVLTGVVQLWMVFVLVLCFGVAQSVDNPVRIAFVSEMVGPEDLSNAVGLSGTLFQVARASSVPRSRAW